jgi:putative nucleotidyltransferase with HDIG domain
LDQQSHNAQQRPDENFDGDSWPMLDCIPQFQSTLANMSDRRRQTLDRLISGIHDVVALPDSTFQLLDLVNSPDVAPSELTDVIRQDPALAARVLSRVNSSKYGLSHSITDLSHAINLLGIKEIRNLALTLGMGSRFATPRKAGNFCRESLWHHSVMVACVAESLALKVKASNPSVFYTAGLLHDLGWILMDHYMPQSFMQTLALIQSGTRREQAEKQVFTIEHTLLGAALGEKWHLPPEVLCAMLYHHQPKSYQGKHAALVNAVSIANYFVDQHVLYSVGFSTTQFPGDDVFLTIGMNSRQSQNLIASLPDLLEQAKGLAHEQTAEAPIA